ncbi:MAG: FTR1 family iron permease [Clostridiales Family XIII bacterium]|nr:FTR1 family iron permease [Clostridiales Family XIII bacterium]
MRKRLVTVAAILLAFICVLPATVFAAYETWNQVVDDMETILNDSYDIYMSGDAEAGKDKVDEAYFGFYEKLGYEKTVMAYISGERAAKVEYEFSFAKKAMIAGDDAAARESLDNLIRYLREDANTLDGTKESAVGVFVASLLIITREGFEAILVVGAIIAYLVKSGNKQHNTAVYIGSLIALALSVVMAFILNALSGANSGENQEIVEGVTMLIAVAVLFYVSNWMVSKAEAAAWTTYIEGMVQASITRGSVLSLAFAAFLAVFREGAETILFYQALLAGTNTYVNMVWLGLAVGCVLLVVIYILIRVLSFRLPLKPFFLGTSVLLAVMCISFLGSGIKELQEGNVISVTAAPGVGTVDILGIYPTLETLVPQIILLVVTVGTFVVQMRKGRRLRAMAESAPGNDANEK